MNTDNKIKINIKTDEKTPIKDKLSLFNILGIDQKEYEKLKAPTPEMEEEIEENYIKINTKNQFDIYNSNESSKKLNEIINYIDELLEEKNKKESISQLLLEKLFPGCQNKSFLICKQISKKLIKSKRINRNFIEEKIKYFFDKRIDIRYSKKLVLNKDNINNLGYIICYSYSKFENFKIFETKDLSKYVKMSTKIDAINDFFQYCNITGKSPIDSSILDFLEEKNNKYALPGEFILLINIFDCINILEIDMNINIDILNDEVNEDFYLFIITHLNIYYLATLTNHFKVNFNNKQLQKGIFDYYNNELVSVYDKNYRDIKKNINISENDIFKKRWDFENDYIFINQRTRFSKEQESIIRKEVITKKKEIKERLFNPRMSYSRPIQEKDFALVNHSNKKRKSSIKNNPLFSFSRAQTEASPEIDDFFLQPSDNIIRNYTFSEKFDKRKIIDKYDEMVDKNKNILELIYMVCLGIIRLTNLKKLDIVMADFYYKEFINHFQQFFSSSKLSSSIKHFHLLNRFIKKMKGLQVFNIEFNSLDYLTFYRILSLLQKNEDLNSLKFSFFSSFISYTPQYLYKLYAQNMDKKEIKNNGIISPESYLLQEFLPFFIENLEVLFELIKSKMDKLEILSFNFDIPEIITLNQRYLICVLKFIINILFLVTTQKSKIKKLIILSPKTILDSRSMLNIENIIENIDIGKNNKNIKELSIQFQFFRINTIKSLISHNLVILKIGEVDIYTLKEIAKYICSFKFYKKSSLKSLTIGILNFIIHFSKEIEYLLNELFSLKIKTLKEIVIYSNIIIKKEKIFYKILEHNWISNCILTLNEKSKLAWKQQEIDERINQIMENKKVKKKVEKAFNKKIVFLIHNELEEELLTANELAVRNKKKFSNTDCDAVWYIRYALIFKYSKMKKFKFNYYEMKNIIFNILKFLYFTKTANIKSEIN